MQIKTKVTYDAGKLAREMPKLIKNLIKDYAIASKKGSRHNIFSGNVKPGIEESTKEARRKRGLLGSPPLLATGQLFKSMKVKELKTTALLQMKEYGYFHHIGKGENKERPFIDTTPKDFTKIFNQFQKDVAKNFKKIKGK